MEKLEKIQSSLLIIILAAQIIVPSFAFAQNRINERMTDIPENDNQLEIEQDLGTLDFPEEYDLFDARMSEVKLLMADAIIADVSSDTLEAVYLFELVFEALSDLNGNSISDEFQYLEFNRILSAAISYYENDAETIDKVESGLSVSLLHDRLDEYIYGQHLEDLEYVEESVEIIPGHIPITYNQKVASIIKFYQTKGRNSVQNWLDRKDRYKAIILPILAEEGVPPEVFYLAMIESGLKPDAYSHKYASGLWQFVQSTGKLYGLKKNWWIDERNDFIKSTYAAARHLKDLYAEFNDWYLAFAAYNSGPGNVRRAIKRNHTTDYWKMSRLPRETRNYVPNIMAALFISNNPQKYGFSVNPERLLEWTDVKIDKSVNLEVISKCSGVDIKTLKLYNPEIRQGVIPALEKNETYTFRMPHNASPQFDSLFTLVEIEASDELVIMDHKVRKGESLWLIAKKYGVRISDIVSLNKLQSSRFIRTGQVLQIPVQGYADEYRKDGGDSQKIYYTVKNGDTLSGIAQKHRTSVTKIKTWNGLRGDFIRIGQKLVIWTKV